MNTFKIKEKNGKVTEYVIDGKTSAIHQLFPERFVYDAKYCSTYDTPLYKLKSQALSRLRLAVCESAFGKAFKRPFHSLLDCGYGNGDFLKYVQVTEAVETLYGHDISGVLAPYDVKQLGHIGDTSFNDIDVITFWDCLEHFPDLSFLQHLKAKALLISLPWNHFNADHNRKGRDIAITNFESWHHRKPNEHLHHFDKFALVATLKLYGWELIFSNNMEDMVRDRAPYNILTAAFQRPV